MKTIYSKDHHLHRIRFEIASGQALPNFETPARADMILSNIEAASLGEIIEPNDFSLEPLLRIHSQDYVEFLAKAWDLWADTYGTSADALPYCFPHRGLRNIEPRHIEGKLGYYSFDLSSGFCAGTWQAIRSSANVALTGAKMISNGEHSAFALCRPPGHHAGRDLMGGYCYVNNAAVAAQFLLDSGKKRVAILDVDYHHGNGTQQIFCDRDDVLFVSIHGDPEDEYPHFLGFEDERGEGAGEGFNINFPLPLGSTDWTVYQPALQAGIKAIREFNADALVISLGLDTFEQDPISSFKLTKASYPAMGAMIAEANIPTLFVMEGGYAVDELGENSVSVLQGFEKRRE
jgi:acetoin utilization deacetylase AcuC-like enzyme